MYFFYSTTVKTLRRKIWTLRSFCVPNDCRESLNTQILSLFVCDVCLCTDGIIIFRSEAEPVAFIKMWVHKYLVMTVQDNCNLNSYAITCVPGSLQFGRSYVVWLLCLLIETCFAYLIGTPAKRIQNIQIHCYRSTTCQQEKQIGTIKLLVW